MTKGKTITVRLPPDLALRLSKVTDPRKPYAPTQTQIMLRGLELALREVERK